jgi:hypothetical protein
MSSVSKQTYLFVQAAWELFADEVLYIRCESVQGSVDRSKNASASTRHPRVRQCNIYGNLTQGRRDGRDDNTSMGETRRISGWILIMDSVVVDAMDRRVGLLLFGEPGVAGATAGGGDSADHV